MEPFQQMVSRYSASYSRSDRDWSSRGNSKARTLSGQEPATGTTSVTGQCLIENGFNQNHGGYKDVEWAACFPEELKLPQALDLGRESGGAMLDISGLQRFYYIRDFHDMRCKYDRVMSVIREQFHREPQKDEVFIIMSKDRRKVRLFNYDRRSASLFEKRFSANYRFMKVEKAGEETFYSIEWKDVVMLLENAVINKLIIK